MIFFASLLLTIVGLSLNAKVLFLLKELKTLLLEERVQRVQGKNQEYEDIQNSLNSRLLEIQNQRYSSRRMK
jgi:hypothetical protein